MLETEKAQRSRVERRRAATKESIISAAMRLFAERGFEATTVADITEAADIGKGTFFTFFPTKSSVFGYLGEQVIGAMQQANAAAISDGLSASLTTRAVFAAGAEWYEANAEMAQLMLKHRSFSFDDEKDSPSRQSLRQLLVGIVEAGRESGEFRTDLRVSDAATLLWAIYFSNAFQWTVSQEDRPLGSLFSASLDVVLKGLEP